MENQILTILNFLEGSIHQGTILTDIASDGEKIEAHLIELGYSLENIEWMVHDDPSIHPLKE